MASMCALDMNFAVQAGLSLPGTWLKVFSQLERGIRYMQDRAKVMGVLGQDTGDRVYGVLEPEHCTL